jgi:hypothetical protein
MTIARAKGAGFSLGEKLTSAIANAMDINATYALDNRSGQTASLASDVTIASGGSITAASGSDIATQSGSTLTVASGTVVAATLSGSSSITLSGASSKLDVTGSGAKVDASASGALIKASASGALITATTTGAKIITSGGGTFEVGGASDQIAFTTSRSYTRAVGVRDYNYILDWTNTAGYLSEYVVSSAVGGVLQYALPVHDNARLKTVEITYKIASSHFPTNKLRFFVTRKKYDEEASSSLYSTGNQSVPGTAAGDYYQGGIIQTYAVDTDQNNTIAASTYAYTLTVLEESGGASVAGNRLIGIRLVFDTIADMRFP